MNQNIFLPISNCNLGKKNVSDVTILCFQEGNEERHIKQMQYISWPDHGVPETSTDFLVFVNRVRNNRIGMVEPTIVHCR